MLPSMNAVCPECHGTLQYSDAGSLFQVRCSNCGWKAQGTVSCTRPDIPPTERMPPMVAKATGPVPAATLKRMREVFAEAQRLPLGKLAAQLASDAGLQVGHLAPYRMSEIEVRLASSGVRLERLPHEEDDR